MAGPAAGPFCVVTRGLWIGAALVALLAVWLCHYSGYAGATGPLLAFHASFLLMMGLAFVTPHNYAYTALAGFLFVGFWTKLLLHVVLGVRLVEAVGEFSGEGPAWDRTLWTCTAGAVGVSTARLLAVWHMRSRPAVQPLAPRGVPCWFAHHRRLVWGGTLCVVLLAAALNWYFDIWQIGVGNRRILPLRLNIAVSWWFSMAAAMWLAVLVDFERRTVGLRLRGVWWWMLVVEAAVSSTTILSRGVFVMRMLPYYLVIAVERCRGRRLLSVPLLTAFASATLVGLVACLAAVSWLRLTIYPSVRVAGEVPVVESARPVERVEVVPVQPSPQLPPSQPQPTVVVATGGAPSWRQIEESTRQVAGLFLTRWIGLEGVMAVTSHSGLGVQLWLRALREDPELGVDSIYQRIAGNPYPRFEGFRFLTLPGVTAVMAYANSLTIVLIGMVLITFTVMGGEALVVRLYDNVFLSSVVAIGVTNVVAQMNFPYLFAIFLLELWLTVVVFWLLFIRGRAHTLETVR